MFNIKFLVSFEVNTHQALTRCAITDGCGNGKAENLTSFVDHAYLNTWNANIYESVKFDNYNKTYEEYVESNTSSHFEKWHIQIDANYLGMIEAGSVLEDAVYPQHDHAGDGRFNNHFYAAQFLSSHLCPLSSRMRSPRALCYGYGNRTDNIDWVLNNNVNLGNSRINDYGLTDAFDYFRKSFVGTVDDRKKYQAKLFVTLGHMVHMLQDLHSPAHCRDNSHANGDYLEIYGRHSGGFRLYDGVFDSRNNGYIKNGISARGSANYLLNTNNYYSYEDFFKKEASWVSKNFFSEAHSLLDKLSTGGLDFTNDYTFMRTTSIYDGDNIYPSPSDISEVAISGAATNLLGKTRWYYMKSNGNNDGSVYGSIASGHNIIGLMERGYLGNWPTMMEVTKKAGNVLNYNDYNKRALQDTAVNVMPRAVASTQAFINFFFRGQMDATLSKDGILTIKNVSDPSLVSDRSLLTFRRGGTLSIYIYDADINTNSNTKLLTLQFNINSDISVNNTYTIDLKEKIQKYYIGADTKLTIVYEGDIGYSQGGYDSYGIGMKGLSVTTTKVPSSPYKVNYISTKIEDYYVYQTNDTAKIYNYDVAYVSELYGEEIYHYPMVWYWSAVASDPYVEEYAFNYFDQLDPDTYDIRPFSVSNLPNSELKIDKYYHDKIKHNIPWELCALTNQTENCEQEVSYGAEMQLLKEKQQTVVQPLTQGKEINFTKELINTSKEARNIKRKIPNREHEENTTVMSSDDNTEQEDAITNEADSNITEEEEAEMQEIIENEQIEE